MNEEHSTTRQGFFSRMFAATTEEDGTTVYSSEEVGREAVEDSSRGFTVERAAEIIKNLPPEVPRPAAVRIVRGTLEAAGINLSDLATSTRAREARLNSEIELSRGRIQQLAENTEKEIRSLEEQIRKAREAREFGVSQQETKISEARSGLEDVTMVRDFFELPPEESEEVEGEAAPPGSEAGEQTQVMEPADEDDTQVLRRPGPLSEGYRDGEEPR
jgi:TolA-binding protein